MAGYAYSLLGGGGGDSQRRIWPAWARKSREPQTSSADRLRVAGFYVAAAMTGLIINLLFFSSSPSSSSSGSTGVPLSTGTQQLDCVNDAALLDSASNIVPEAYIRPGLGNYVTPNENEWSRGAIERMVAKTKGYYARDYSLWLGWNNMRYIIEAAALHAHLLNRTLVLPTYVYARSCEWSLDVCAAYAKQVNRGEATGSTEWNNRPLDEQMGWMIPIDIMLDLKTFREHVPAITVAEYLALHNLPASLELSNGKWDSVSYHSTATGSSPSLATLKNEEFDPKDVIRLDKLPEKHSVPRLEEGSMEWNVHNGLKQYMDVYKVLSIDTAREYIKTSAHVEWHSDAEMVQVLRRYGYGVVYTYDGLPSTFGKTVENPVAKAASLDMMRGFVDDYGHYTEDVVWLPGEVHGDRKPGTMVFSTPEVRDTYTNITLRGIVHLPSIDQLADAVASAMRELTKGRKWMAVHWRRGDFVTYNWNHNRTAIEGVAHLLSRIEEGRQILRKNVLEGHAQVPNVPGVTADKTFDDAGLPLVGDKWYLGTDERHPEALNYARSKGGTLISDLISNTPHLRRLLGWPLLYTDVLALVEQAVMARAAFFFGYAYSSVAGGVVNLRAVRGMDPRAMILEGT